MKLIWVAFVIEILVLGILNSIIDVADLGFIVVLIHLTFTSVILLKYTSPLKYMLLLGFLVRVSFMFWDLFARNVFILPNSGADSEMFYKSSLLISRDLSMLGNTRGGMFSNIMGLLFGFIGDHRIVGQYINVLFGVSIILIVYKMLKLLNINKSTQTSILIITSFFPNSIIMSAIFLREIIPTFFVAISLLEFICWFQSGKIKNAGFAIFYLGIASMFHSGVLGIAIGYFFGWLFYNHYKKQLKFSLKSVGLFILMFIVIVISFIYFEDLIFGKFKSVEDIEDIYNTANRRIGSSAYLTSIKINNPVQLIIFGPLKALFFLISPLPFNWRGFIDIFSFYTDSLFYLFTLFYFIKNKNQFRDNKNLIVIFIWMISGVSLIFGIGVGNAGTAIRHRQKLISLFLILLGLMKNSKKRLNHSRNKFRRKRTISYSEFKPKLDSTGDEKLIIDKPFYT